MTIPPAIAIAALLFTAILIALTIASLAAWYGIDLQRIDERRRMMRGAWTCDSCGRTMRFVGETVEVES